MYRRNPSLQDYLLADAEKVAIDLYYKNESSSSWEIINYQGGDIIELKSINLSYSIKDIYEDIVFEGFSE